MNLPGASQLLLVDERDVEVLEEVTCNGCGHPEHEGACTVVLEIARGPLQYGLTYVATGVCGCGEATTRTTVEVH